MHEQLAAAAALLRDAQAVACLTGVGVSAESGVATFRGAATGLWSSSTRSSLLRRRASPQTPAWSGAGTWNGCKNLVGAAQPGPYRAGKAGRASPSSTSSRRTSTTSTKRGGSFTVYHLHGSITRYRCNRCAAPYTLQPQDITAQTPPVCRCRGLIRPDIVWFGEMLPREMERPARGA